MRALLSDVGARLQEAPPSAPVQVLGAGARGHPSCVTNCAVCELRRSIFVCKTGLDSVPTAGDEFHVVDSEGEARELAEATRSQLLEARFAASSR